MVKKHKRQKSCYGKRRGSLSGGKGGCETKWGRRRGESIPRRTSQSSFVGGSAFSRSYVFLGDAITYSDTVTGENKGGRLREKEVWRSRFVAYIGQAYLPQNGSHNDHSRKNEDVVQVGTGDS